MFVGEYCNQCGQKHIERFDLKYLWKLFHADVLELDRGLWHTVKDLTLNPGATIRAYLDGNTKTYYSPVKYMAVVATAIYVAFSLAFTGDPVKSDFFSMDAWKERFFSSETPPFSPRSFVEIVMLPSIMVNGGMLIYYLILLPFMALAARFILRTLNFTEYIIAWMYLWAHLLLLTLALCVLLLPIFISNEDLFAYSVFAVEMILLLFYFTGALRHLTKGRWIPTFFKMILSMYGGLLMCGITVWLLLNVVKAAQAF